MPPTELALAERLARFAHADQTEASTGDPYVLHLERVVGIAKDLAPDHHVDVTQAQIVGWLHDIIEDTDYTADALAQHGFSPDVLAAVVLLTRGPETMTYRQYIERIAESGNALAWVVKLADLIDHLRPNCPPSLKPRYEHALGRLRSAWRVHV